MPSTRFHLFLACNVVAVGGLAVVWRRVAKRRRATVAAERNPGPEGGYLWAAWSLRKMPAGFNVALKRVGTSIAYWTLPGQRANSREYLRLVLGREPTADEVWQHFHAYTVFLALRLRICDGLQPRLRFADEGQGAALRALLAAGEPALYGTMHVGYSDLVGFFLGDFGGHVHMIRKRVGNSEDTEGLGRRYARSVTFVWINDWSRLILAMNDALRAGHSLAMQCDRPEYSSKREGFEFLGELRLFPFTIYHLAIMHERAVVFCYAVPDADDPEMTVVTVLPIFRPDVKAARAENFAAARVHFQGVLATIEAQLRRTPYMWFNYTSMNPVCTAEGGPVRARAGRTWVQPAPVEAHGSIASGPTVTR